MLHALSRQFRDDWDSVAIAGEFASLLQDIRTVLSPVLGVRGVAALLQRSLHLARLQHPWLADIPPGGDLIDDPALQSWLAGQDRAACRAAVDCVFSSFHALLTSLIGASLTERLFDSMWAPPPSGNAAQEPQP